jgi:hypothetical protein
MMYSNQLAVAIKSNGKVLREQKDTVLLPFGSEYSVFIKNLNTVRALVHIEIDGQDVGEGGFVINANDSIDIERFIRNGNLKEGNRFKFIERTAGIEKHRGVGVEDGLIRVEFQFEKPAPLYWYDPYKYDPWKKQWPYDNTYWGTCNGFTSDTLSRSVKGTSLGNNIQASSATYTASNSSDAAPTVYVDVNDVGITVPGSVSDQQFQTVSSFPLESTKHVIVMKLLGETETGTKVVAPVTVKSKPKCTSCGRVNKATAKFCVECGTSLQLV